MLAHIEGTNNIRIHQLINAPTSTNTHFPSLVLTFLHLYSLSFICTHFPSLILTYLHISALYVGYRVGLAKTKGSWHPPSLFSFYPRFLSTQHARSQLHASFQTCAFVYPAPKSKLTSSARLIGNDISIFSVVDYGKN